jgi:hypothetical protein
VLDAEQGDTWEGGRLDEDGQVDLRPCTRRFSSAPLQGGRTGCLRRGTLVQGASRGLWQLPLSSHDVNWGRTLFVPDDAKTEL